ncbi:MAG: DUF1385 domain-containing protein [Oscillospiraceae bacterium]|jgi:uncharacterized protein YqhQ|nr:DUF1385 domain-containing protein [Oscillospiraceae bacterium]
MADNAKREKCPDIGGQAVVEGVMMKSPDAIAVSVRRPDGSIARSYQKYIPPSKKHKWMGLPVIRGVVNMVVMLMTGVRILELSTKLLGMEEEEPSKFEKWLSAKLGQSIEKIVMGVAIVFALGLSLLLFMVIPNFIATLINRSVHSLLVVNLFAGLARILILIGYIYLTGLIPDMKRVYMYHGAEHKTVYCHEAGIELTPENAKQFSTLHPRCGTSFLLLVMIIAVLLGAVSDQLIHIVFGIERMSFALRLLRSLITLPLVAGVSYEALQALAHSNAALVRALRWPGLQMQRLTTREPDSSMLEIAIDAMQRALGNWNQEESVREDEPAAVAVPPAEAVEP